MPYHEPRAASNNANVLGIAWQCDIDRARNLPDRSILNTCLLSFSKRLVLTYQLYAPAYPYLEGLTPLNVKTFKR